MGYGVGAFDACVEQLSYVDSAGGRVDGDSGGEGGGVGVCREGVLEFGGVGECIWFLFLFGVLMIWSASCRERS